MFVEIEQQFVEFLTMTGSGLAWPRLTNRWRGSAMKATELTVVGPTDSDSCVAMT